MKIAILVPLCSKNQDWVSLKDVDFISIMLDSFLISVSNKHNYKFYLGFDENDKFFVENDKNLRKRFPNMDITMLPKKCNGNPCHGWNILLDKAFKDGNDYFFQCGSDIIQSVKGWDDYFVNLMKKHDDDIICGGVDMPFWCERVIRDQAGILENVFFGRPLYERLGFLFPPEVKSWFSDDVITKIYRNVDRCYICPNIKYHNVNRVGGNNDKSRYVPPEKEAIAKNWPQVANKWTIEAFPEMELTLAQLNQLPKYN